MEQSNNHSTSSTKKKRALVNLNVNEEDVSPIPNDSVPSNEIISLSNDPTTLEKFIRLMQLMSQEEQNRKQGSHKRVKSDWLGMFLSLHQFNDKRGYEKLKEIGDGTYSRVVSARKKDTGELVAIKKLYFNAKEPITLSMVREIMCLMSCCHENIIGFKEVLVTVSKYKQEKLSIVTELCDFDLYTLAKKRRFDREYCKDMVYQMLLGVKYLHSIHLIHRDIKLSNYLITEAGVVKLCDFGLGKNFLYEKEPHSPVVVTLSYRAPELLLSDRNYTFAVDMWALGCCFAELFLGRPLFSPSRFDIEQLMKIFSMFGVEANDPIFADCSLSFNRVAPSDWPRDVFGNSLTASELFLLRAAFNYDKRERLTAQAALAHSYWKEAWCLERVRVGRKTA